MAHSNLFELGRLSERSSSLKEWAGVKGVVDLRFSRPCTYAGRAELTPGDVTPNTRSPSERLETKVPGVLVRRSPQPKIRHARLPGSLDDLTTRAGLDIAAWPHLKISKLNPIFPASPNQAGPRGKQRRLAR